MVAVIIKQVPQVFVCSLMFRIKPNRLAVFSDGPLVLSLAPERKRKIEVREDVARFERNSFVVLGNRFVDPPLVCEGKPEVYMGRIIVRVQVNGFAVLDDGCVILTSAAICIPEIVASHCVSRIK